MIRRFITFLIRAFLNVIYKVEVKGLENIPGSGGVIIASNHISNIDPPAILSYVSLIRDDFYVVAKKELFKNKIFSVFLKKMGAISVDRKNVSVSAVKESLKVLNNGMLLLIFPEGTRKKGNNELTPKNGISFLVKKTQVPVVPTRIFNVKNGLKLSKIVIVFDEPIKTYSYDFSDEEAFKKFPEMIMNKIYSINI